MTSSSGAPWVLGISASHNGSACLLHGDEIVVAIQEERLLRSKRARVRGACEPLAIRYCLEAAGIGMKDVSMIVVALQRKRSLPDENIARNRAFEGAGPHVPRLVIPHHLGHAIGAFATSGFEEAAVLVVDGGGSPCEDLPPDERAVIVGGERADHEMASLYRASGTTMIPLEKHLGSPNASWPLELDAHGELPGGMPPFGSLGSMYSAVGRQIFGEPMDGAGKVMGLAPYGRPTIPVDEFFRIVDGGFVFSSEVLERYRHHERWPARREEYADLAASVQAAVEEGVLHLARRLREIGGSDRLCYAGGVALNSVTNERLVQELSFADVFLMPAAEDSGPALGAAYYGLWKLTGRNGRRPLRHDAVGRIYTPAEIDRAIEAAPAVTATAPRDVIDSAVDALESGKILGWFDGRSELGPRALGQRSILCDPRRPDAKEMLNRRVKHREAFRPFAPVVLLEKANEWFDLGAANHASPFMLRVARFREDKAPLVPSVVHVDGTGRLQTVTAEENGRLHTLVERFFARTGVPIVLNTSLNVAGEPLVETPEDALFCLLYTSLDAVVLGDRIVHKKPGYRSILDLVVEVVADWVSFNVPMKDGGVDLDDERSHTAPMRPPFGVSLDAQRTIVARAEEIGEPYLILLVTTPWGRAAYLVGAGVIPPLRFADGRSTGWQILERARARYGDAITEAGLSRTLGWLRRARAIAFRETAA